MQRAGPITTRAARSSGAHSCSSAGSKCKGEGKGPGGTAPGVLPLVFLARVSNLHCLYCKACGLWTGEEGECSRHGLGVHTDGL